MGVPNLFISHGKAPLATPKINLPSVKISAVATSPAYVLISCKGKTATLVEIEIFFVNEAILTAICNGDGIISKFIK